MTSSTSSSLSSSSTSGTVSSTSVTSSSTSATSSSSVTVTSTSGTSSSTSTGSQTSTSGTVPWRLGGWDGTQKTSFFSRPFEDWKSKIAVLHVLLSPEGYTWKCLRRSVFGSQRVEGGDQPRLRFGCPLLWLRGLPGTLGCRQPVSWSCQSSDLCVGDQQGKKVERKKRKGKEGEAEEGLRDSSSGLCSGILPCGMDTLLAYGRQLGLDPVVTSSVLKLGRPLSDSNWVQAVDAKKGSREMATELFKVGAHLEHQCYDSQWKDQGRCCAQLIDWEDAENGLFQAAHVLASDGYYEHYAQHDLAKGCVFHICIGPASQCRVKLPRGDKREVVHIDKWRLLSPQVMAETGYLKDLGAKLGRQALDQHLQEQRVPLPAGSGLDAAIQTAANPPAGKADEDDEARKRKEKRKKRDSSSSPRRTKRLQDHVEELEKKRMDERKKERKKAARAKQKKKKSKKAKGKSPTSGTSSGTVESSSSQSLFRKASARGGDLWRLAEKKPGRLTEMGLREMSRYLAGKTEQELDKNPWGSVKVLAYLNQIILTNNPPVKIGIRAHRELLTLCTGLDLLLGGETMKCLDLLMQRLKAVEASVIDGNWSLGRHYELIPQLSQEQEREMAQKAELRHQKLKDAVGKSSKNPK